jgi:hypothetical protein
MNKAINGKYIPLYLTASMLLGALSHADAHAKSSNNKATEHSVLPAAIHLEGVGNIAGVAIQSKNLGEDDFSAVAGVAVGDAQAALLSLSDVAWAGGKLSFTTVFVADLTLETQYARGTSTGTRYEQSLSGLGQFVSFKSPIDQQQHWYTNLGLTLVSFEGYADAHGGDITINQSGLHDVFSTTATVGLSHDARPLTTNRSGMKANIELASQLLRAGQSDQGQVNYAASYAWSFMGDHKVTTYARGSHAFVLSKRAEYDEVSEVLAEINGQCATANVSCTGLENDLANYIVDSNNNGSAQPLGGAYGLRSYSEQYIKAANTLLEGVELTLAMPWGKKNVNGQSIELVAFAEAGQANDALSSLTDDSLYSVGVGARFNINDLPIRLEAAVGSDDTQAWFLTAGKRW